MYPPIIVVTPVTEPHRLAVLLNSLATAEDVKIFWFVIFDCTQGKHLQAWQNVFRMHEEQNKNIECHCILSDKYQSPFGYKNINFAFNILENIAKDKPEFGDSWVYQLHGDTEMHPQVIFYLNSWNKKMRPNLFFLDTTLPSQIKVVFSNMAAFAFRLKILRGNRYDTTDRHNLKVEADFMNSLLKNAGTERNDVLYVESPFIRFEDV